MTMLPHTDAGDRGTDSHASSLQVRVATAADSAAMLALHRTGFGSQWEMRHWRWRYADNPLRRTELVGAFTAAGECVASFCGVPLPCDYDGERAVVQRAGDVVLHPRLRASIAGGGVLRRIAELFCRRFGGGDTRVIYGFPEPALVRCVVRNQRFEVLADVPALARDCSDGDDDGAGGDVDVTVGLPRGIEELAAVHASTHRTGIRRDAAYLRWRYATNPLAVYHSVSLRGANGALLGAAIVREGGMHRDALAVVEWLVPGERHEVAGRLFAALDRLARQRRLMCVGASFLPQNPEFALFQHSGFRVRATPHQIVFRSYQAPIDRRFLFANWSHSLGDLDGV